MKLNSSNPSGKSDASFYSVGRATLPSLTLLIDVAIALKCFGVAISYLIVIGDLMPYVMRQFGASGVWVARELWVFLGWVLAVPFSLQRDLSSLSTVSSLAIGFVSFFALLVFLYTLGISGLDPCGGSNAGSTVSCRGDIEAVVLDGHTLKAIPIFVFCFTCQQVSFVCAYRSLLTPRLATAECVYIPISF
jgi:amino acid permease